MNQIFFDLHLSFLPTVQHMGAFAGEKNMLLARFSNHDREK